METIFRKRLQLYCLIFAMGIGQFGCCQSKSMDGGARQHQANSPHNTAATMLSNGIPQNGPVDMDSLRIATPNDWILTIFSDGHARYGFGDFLGAETPPKIFNFVEVKKQLFSKSRNGPGIVLKEIIFDYFTPMTNESSPRHVFDFPYVQSLFRIAHDNTRKGYEDKDLQECWVGDPPSQNPEGDGTRPDKRE